MNENMARYIIRMIATFRSNVFFFDATTADAIEIDRMKERYDQMGGFEPGAEVAISEFILRISENGVPGGDYFSEEGSEFMDMILKQRGIPRIVRPKQKEQ